MPKTQSKHRFLVSGEVHFIGKDGTGPHTGKVNGILITNTKELNAHDIGRAQQVLQMVHHGRVEDPTEFEIFDVHILGLTYLGFLTDEKFQEKPASMQLQERSLQLPSILDH